MDDKQQKWLNQFWSNIGLREYFRFGCAITIWVFITAAASIVSTYINHSMSPIVFVVFSSAIFILPLLLRWQPVYSLFRAIFGNKNLPIESMPQSTAKPSGRSSLWWFYFPATLFFLLDLVLLYLFIKYLFK